MEKLFSNDTIERVISIGWTKPQVGRGLKETSVGNKEQIYEFLCTLLVTLERAWAFS